MRPRKGKDGLQEGTGVYIYRVQVRSLAKVLSGFCFLLFFLVLAGLGLGAWAWAAWLGWAAELGWAGLWAGVGGLGWVAGWLGGRAGYNFYLSCLEGLGFRV